MEEWVNSLSSGSSQGGGIFITAFLLGIAGVFTSCCTLPIFSAVFGFSASLSLQHRKRTIILTSLSFLAGTILSLAIIGALFSLFSNAVAGWLGYYWKIIAGIVFIFFGLNTLKLIPIQIPALSLKGPAPEGGLWSALLFGLVLAGTTTACNALCNPAFTIIISTSFLSQSILKTSLILLLFGLGYGLPLAAAMAGIGIGLNRLTTRLQKVNLIVQYVAGILLLGIGFYFLATV